VIDQDFPSMPTDDKTPAPVEPPKIYFAACGAMCDVFWWARRDPSGDEPQPLPVKSEEIKTKTP
jgi:hypothetical protein